MSESECSSGDHPSEDVSASNESGASGEQSEAGGAGDAGMPAPTITVPRDLVVVVPEMEREFPDGPSVAPRGWLPAPRLVLAAAAVGVVVAVGCALVWEHRQQANVLAEGASETESLAQVVKSLKVRLDALDTTKPPDDLADLRRSVGELKSTVVTRANSTALWRSFRNASTN
jgi:hypothetical protein